MSRVALAVALTGALLAGVAGFAPSPAEAAGGPRFGVAAHLLWDTLPQVRSDLDRMKAAGMTYVRFDVSWKNSEPARGEYRYLTKLDAIIRAIKARGMRLTMTVIETPSWANGGAGAFAPPTDVQDYARFVGMLAGRYAGRSGMVYEIWNEPNDVHFWTTGPDVAAYTAMLKASFAAIKQADPDATVLGGSILDNDLAFLRGIYANGGGGSFNALSIHPYAAYRAPGSTVNPFYSFKLSVPAFAREMARHGSSRPIWITEFGWPTWKVSDVTRARYFRQAVAIAKGWTNVRAVAAYTFRRSQSREFGLVGSTSTTASWRAYVAAAR
jgi:hypothetical protein